MEGSSETSADGGEDVDEFLSSLGFEFINVARPSTDNDDDNGHTLNADGKSRINRQLLCFLAVFQSIRIESNGSNFFFFLFRVFHR